MARNKNKAPPQTGGPPAPVAPATVSDDIIAPELREELGTAAGSNAAVLEPRKKKQKKEEAPEPIPMKKPLSKSEQKREEFEKKKRAKLRGRSEVLTELARYAIPMEHLKLMRSTQMRGHRGTTKQRLGEALAHERAGIHTGATEGVHLHQLPRDGSDNEEGDEEDQAVLAQFGSDVSGGDISSFFGSTAAPTESGVADGTTQTKGKKRKRDEADAEDPISGGGIGGKGVKRTRAEVERDEALARGPEDIASGSTIAGPEKIVAAEPPKKVQKITFQWGVGFTVNVAKKEKTPEESDSGADDEDGEGAEDAGASAESSGGDGAAVAEEDAESESGDVDGPPRPGAAKAGRVEPGEPERKASDAAVKTQAGLAVAAKATAQNKVSARVMSTKAPATPGIADVESSAGKKSASSKAKTAEIASARAPREGSESPVMMSKPLKDAEGRKAFHVQVKRKPEIQAQRLRLPIIAEEQEVMEKITENDVIIVCGETGSGKTTQVPQFLYEAGYGHPDSDTPGRIGVTEPRRVAALSMAARVASELNVESGSTVSYQVRYDTNVSPATRIKFMTDGILLREIQGDFLLSNYSAIILDEAHERNLNTDILIGLLSRIVALRRKHYDASQSKRAPATSKKSEEEKLVSTPVVAPTKPLCPLKLVVMSATLRVEDFTANARLFPVAPPVLKVDARQFKVTVHFNKKTPLHDYTTAAYNKICKIHARLPPGGILVFLTGQQEIEVMCEKLRKRFARCKKRALPAASGTETKEEGAEWADIDEASLSEDEDEGGVSDEGAADSDAEDSDRGADDNTRGRRKAKTKSSQGAGEDEDEDEDVDAGPVHVLPLYSMLATKLQMRVFKESPADARLIVVATNVAETSLTIPGIRYVVDCGKGKQRVYYETSGMSAFEVDWISKANADQRSGRAGRTGPGHCYRLYSSAVFNDHFTQFSDPEIKRMPIDGMVLQMKSMNIENVVNFPFPTPPDRSTVKAAIKALIALGGLDSATERITALGQTLSAFPVAPRFGRMLTLGHQGDCMAYVIALVAALTVRDPFLSAPSKEDKEDEDGAEASDEDDDDDDSVGDAKKEARRKQKQALTAAQAVFHHAESDLLAVLRAVGAYEYAKDTTAFCRKYHLHEKSMQEIQKLRGQLAEIVQRIQPDLALDASAKLAPPTPAQEALLRQILLAGLVDQVAHRAPQSAAAIAAGRGQDMYQCVGSAEPVFLHPGSRLYSLSPEWVAYREIVTTSRPYMRGITSVDPEWLARLGSALVTHSKPHEQPQPLYNAEKDRVECYVSAYYGPHNWDLGPQRVEHPPTGEKYKHFAKFLLAGEVVPKLASMKEFLSAAPAFVTNKFANPRITAILQPLAEEKIDTRAKLVAKWKQQPNFLLAAYKAWVDKTHHRELMLLWSTLGDG